jgi:hypothetical protein
MVFNGARGAAEDGNVGWGDAAQMVGGGAMLGATIGSIVPGLGTGIGALIGGAAGGIIAGGMKISQMADGGTVTRSGLSWVGEEGPELAFMPRGATVVPHRESMALAAGVGTTTNVTMNVRIEGGRFDERTLALHLDSIARRAAATNTRTQRPLR